MTCQRTCLVVPLLLLACGRDGNQPQINPSAGTQFPQMEDRGSSPTLPAQPTPPQRSQGYCTLTLGEILACSTPSHSFGRADWDAPFDREIAIQNRFWGVTDTVWRFKECAGANAVAPWSTRDIYFGGNRFAQTMRDVGDILGNFGILAHEKAHRIQDISGFYRGAQPSRVIELEADAFSGFYMSLEKNLDSALLRVHLDVLYSIGDEDYNQPYHHGTAIERRYMGLFGFAVGENAKKAGRIPTWKELHEVFTTEIMGKKLAPDRELEMLAQLEGR